MVGTIDLPLPQPVDEVFGVNVDHFDFLCRVKNPVGNGLLNQDSRDARHHIVHRIQVLDIESRPDLDPGVAELFHVLPSLLMSESGSVRVCQLIDQHHLGFSSQAGV